MLGRTGASSVVLTTTLSVEFTPPDVVWLSGYRGTPLACKAIAGVTQNARIQALRLPSQLPRAA